MSHGQQFVNKPRTKKVGHRGEGYERETHNRQRLQLQTSLPLSDLTLVTKDEVTV